MKTLGSTDLGGNVEEYKNTPSENSNKDSLRGVPIEFKRCPCHPQVKGTTAYVYGCRHPFTKQATRKARGHNERLIEDLSGRKFGKWTVLFLSYVDKWGGKRWAVRCECGNENVAQEAALHKKLSTQCRSCGLTRSGLRRGQQHKHINDLKSDWLIFSSTWRSFPCSDCNEVYRPDIMQYDHMPGHKRACGINVVDYQKYGEKKLLKEIKKCELVCPNCHFERTWRRQHGNFGLPLAISQRVATAGLAA